MVTFLNSRYFLQIKSCNIHELIDRFQPDDENLEVLRIENVAFSDEGWYTCVVANSLGSTSESGYLRVVPFTLNESVDFVYFYGWLSFC
jgi:Immunoglobulin I-set domain